jgi:hypothetical protein
MNYSWPGERVQQSGAYLVQHAEHRNEHRVIAFAGDVFPFCKICKDRVRFRLLTPADYFAHDHDLGADTVSVALA